MASQPITVFLVSEDRGLLRCLGKLLKICGCEVCQVGAFQRAGRVGVRFARFPHPRRPGGHGRRLGNQPLPVGPAGPGRGLYVVLTHASEVHELYRALEAGVDDFLAKPVIYCELLARLRAGRGSSSGNGVLANNLESILRPGCRIAARWKPGWTGSCLPAAASCRWGRAC